MIRYSIFGNKCESRNQCRKGTSFYFHKHFYYHHLMDQFFVQAFLKMASEIKNNIAKNPSKSSGTASASVPFAYFCYFNLEFNSHLLIRVSK